MKKLIRLKESRAVRLAASAVAVAAVVAGATGIVAGEGNAAPAAKTSAAHRMDKFKHPKLTHGLLTIEGTDSSDKIVLRLQAGNPRRAILEPSPWSAVTTKRRRRQGARRDLRAQAPERSNLLVTRFCPRKEKRL